MFLTMSILEFHQQYVGCKGTADFLLMQMLNCNVFLFLQKAFVGFCWFWIFLDFVGKIQTAN